MLPDFLGRAAGLISYSSRRLLYLPSFAQVRGFNCLLNTKTSSLLSVPVVVSVTNPVSRMDKFVTKTPREGGRDSGDPPSRRMTREAVWSKEKERYLNMSIDDKRKEYKCKSSYLTLDDVQAWPQYYKEHGRKLRDKAPTHRDYAPVNPDLNEKISIWRGDITKLEIDAIANAANSSLMGGGGVDGAIHAAAGSSMLHSECETLQGCDTGDAKITGGYKLPAKYIIHTVGPIGLSEKQLRSCYSKCLNLLKEYKLRSIAFPCISTGIYGYPNENAARTALDTIRKWLQTNDNAQLVDRIIFCLFLPIDVNLYEQYMQVYFPIEEPQEIPSPPPGNRGDLGDIEGAAADDDDTNVKKGDDKQKEDNTNVKRVADKGKDDTQEDSDSGTEAEMGERQGPTDGQEESPSVSPETKKKPPPEKNA